MRCIRKRTRQTATGGSPSFISPIVAAAWVVFGGLFPHSSPPCAVQAFVLPTLDSTTTTTVSYGVRSALRRGFNRVRRPFRKTTRTPSEKECDPASPTATTTRPPSFEYLESSPDWYQYHNNKNNHHHQNGVPVLAGHHEQEEEEEENATVISRYNPASMFQTDTTTTLSHVETTTTHPHPSENIDQDATTPAPSFEDSGNNDDDEEDGDSPTRRRRLDFQSDDPLYILPPREEGSTTTTRRTNSRLEKEFRDMLAHFSRYSMRDLYALRDPRMRTLVHGVAASADDREVYRAFEVLFEDLLPLRVAGRLVFKQLRSMMDRCIREREEQIEHVVRATGLDAREVEEARIVFFEVASKLNHDVYLTPEQLTATRMFHSIRMRLDLESPSALVQKLDRHGNRKIGLEDFLVGLHHCAEEQCEIEQNQCYALEVVHDLLEEIDSMEDPVELETKTSKIIAREAKELKYVMRYDEMVEIFRSWKNEVPGLWDKTGRKWEVVQGCFVGAENQRVVDALRIVYVDYSPLRVAAEFILSLSSSLLGVKAEVKR